jgi:GTPase
MPVPKVAVVGRPNVGKSSVFNWLAGRRIAIVDPTSGVTRDRNTTLVEVGADFFELIDTGGMGIEDRDSLTDEVEHQIRVALNEADLVLFVVDAIDGVTPLDLTVAEKLRRLDRPLAIVVNKCDNERLEQGAGEFYRLGRDKLVTVSAAQNHGKEKLLAFIRHNLPRFADAQRPPKPVMKLAIAGRRNVGKSTFINQLAQEQRVIVSEVPGTTRDSVDVHFEKDGQQFIAIDTAGVRKAKSVADSIEFYSMARSQRSIRRADVVFMFIDPTQGIGQVDRRLVMYIQDLCKPCVFVVNKWDLMRPMATGDYEGTIEHNFPGMPFAPIAFLTAKEGRNVQSLLDLAQSLFRQANERVGTGLLNRVISQAMAAQGPPAGPHGTPKVYYATQVAVAPPTIVAFCKHPADLPPPYQRYLLRELREALPFQEVPIKLYLRQRTSRNQPSDKTRPESPISDAGD